MGEVYLGFDPRLERRVAVKTIRPERRLSPRLKARFLREARLLSKIGHPPREGGGRLERFLSESPEL
jgi:serine/threonine protein kinase